jgi:phosphoglycolate phosphatase
MPLFSSQTAGHQKQKANFMTSSPFSSLIFDLDGTLVDTAPDLIRALNHVMAQHDLAAIEAQQVRPLVGLGARVMLEHGFAHHGCTLGEPDLKAAHRTFLAYYEENICVESHPYDGVWDVIPAFYEEGYCLSVCTNKPEGLAVGLLDQLDLAKYFSAICGSNTVPNRKPHADHLAVTTQRAAAPLKGSVMVGDSTPDVEAARNAGIPIIGFDYGYSPIAMAELSPDILLSSFHQLPQALASLANPV